MTELMRAKSSFEYGGEIITKGQVVSTNHPAYRNRKHLFTSIKNDPDVSFTDTETTDNTPDTKRNNSLLSSKIRESQRDK